MYKVVFQTCLHAVIDNEDRSASFTKEASIPFTPWAGMYFSWEVLDKSRKGEIDEELEASYILWNCDKAQFEIWVSAGMGAYENTIKSEEDWKWAIDNLIGAGWTLNHPSNP